tara:strand:+ start:7609 stop:9030 length:1422 start_codon:yes stop_codon:yes gene_type:complete
MAEKTHWYIFNEEKKLLYFTTKREDSILDKIDPALKARHVVAVLGKIHIPDDHYLEYNPLDNKITPRPLVVPETPPTVNVSGAVQDAAIQSNQGQIKVIVDKLTALENMILHVASTFNTVFPRDTAVFGGNQADYTLQPSADSRTIVVTSISTSAVDIVTDVSTLKFADGDVYVSLNAGGLVLTCSSGADSINIVGDVAVEVLGQSGDDTLVGGTGADTIDGGVGDDMISGGAGDDTLIGAGGSDTVDGGTGNDVSVFTGSQADYTFESSVDGLTTTITNRSTGDVDTVTNVETLSFADGEIHVSVNPLSGVVLTGQASDSIEVTGSVGVTVIGNEGDDVITGGDGGDTIDGGDGDDTIAGGTGDDTIDGGGGDDIIAGGTGDDRIDGGEGDDIVTFAGSVQDYTFESSFDGRKITITHVSDGGVDTVTGVETLRFDDGDIRVSLNEDGLVLTGDAASNVKIVGRFPVTVNTA